MWWLWPVHSDVAIVTVTLQCFCYHVLTDSCRQVPPSALQPENYWSPVHLAGSLHLGVLYEWNCAVCGFGLLVSSMYRAIVSVHSC